MVFISSRIEKVEWVAIGLLVLATEISFREYQSFKNFNHYVAPHVSSEEKSSSPLFEESLEDPDQEIPITGIQKRTLYVTCGDTLSSLLHEIGISFQDIDAISKALSKFHNVKHLQIGQPIDLQWNATPHESKLIQLETVDSCGNRISLSALSQGYDVAVHKRVLKTYPKIAMGTIRTNFSFAAQQKGVPQFIIQETIRALNPLINTHKIRSHSAFEIVYEEKKDVTTGKLVGKRSLKYASVTSHEKTYKIYGFGNQYYTEKGESLKTEFLILPFKNKNVRISSKFGYRKHPILGVVKKHCGIDYSAQYGTDVCAAAQGVVVASGRYGGYGLYVRIRHANGFETAYGHLSSIFVKKGDYVSQGHVIGKVGSTGRATGPHLHHELIRNHVKVDPQKYCSLGSNQLTGKSFSKFKQFKNEIEEQIQNEKEKARAEKELSL